MNRYLFGIFVLSSLGFGLILIPTDASESMSACGDADAATSQLVCNDPELRELDATLYQTYIQARKGTMRGLHRRLHGEQRAFLDGLSACGGSEARACLKDAYLTRIFDLQTTYLVGDQRDPVRYICGEADDQSVTTVLHATEPPTMVIEHDGRTEVLQLEDSDRGSRYEGGYATFWTMGNQATFAVKGKSSQSCTTKVGAGTR